MKKVAGLALSLFALAVAAPASAADVVNDSFDTYAGNQLGWNGSGVWTTNSVDLVSSGSYGLTCAGGAGNCLDLTGSGATGSISRAIAVGAGTYVLSFDYTGNQLDAFGGPYPQAGFTASIGGNNFVIGPLLNNSAAFTTFTSTPFTLTGPTTLSFTQNGGNLYRGSILDNVRLTAAVPEPATWLSMILGFGILGSMLRTRRQRPVAIA